MTQYPLVLKLDVAGNPDSWISYQAACYYYAKDLVAYQLGGSDFPIYGGVNRSGDVSRIDMNSIIAVRGDMKGHARGVRTPVLSNQGLFRRDSNVCAYCGEVFRSSDLTRDHVQPHSRRGPNTWVNCVTACGRCNRVKNDRTPEEANMKLLYVPYAPNSSEFLILMNRNILQDQMEFLLSRVPHNSRVHGMNWAKNH